MTGGCGKSLALNFIQPLNRREAVDLLNPGIVLQVCKMKKMLLLFNVYSDFTSLSTIFKAYHDGVWLRQ